MQKLMLTLFQYAQVLFLPAQPSPSPLFLGRLFISPPSLCLPPTTAELELRPGRASLLHLTRSATLCTQFAPSWTLQVHATLCAAAVHGQTQLATGGPRQAAFSVRSNLGAASIGYTQASHFCFALWLPESSIKAQANLLRPNPSPPPPAVVTIPHLGHRIVLWMKPGISPTALLPRSSSNFDRSPTFLRTTAASMPSCSNKAS